MLRHSGHRCIRLSNYSSPQRNVSGSSPLISIDALPSRLLKDDYSLANALATWLRLTRGSIRRILLESRASRAAQSNGRGRSRSLYRLSNYCDPRAWAAAFTEDTVKRAHRGDHQFCSFSFLQTTVLISRATWVLVNDQQTRLPRATGVFPETISEFTRRSSRGRRDR